MAKKTLTQSTVVTNNIQSQPDQPTIGATALKQKFDQSDIDNKAYLNNTLLPELQSETLNDSGAHAIGLNTPNSTENNVGDQIESILQAGSGTIPPDDTITYAKLVQEVRQDIQSNYKIYDAGGTASAVTVTTDEGNFTYTDGKYVQFEVTSAGTISTLSVDGGSAITAQDKDTDPLDVEVGDIILAKYDAGGGSPFFLLAARGGASAFNYKNLNVQDGLVSTQTLSLVLSETGAGFITTISRITSATTYIALKIDGVYVIGSATEGRLLTTSSTTYTLQNRLEYATSFELYCTSATNWQIFYKNGDDYKKATPDFASGVPKTTQATTALSVVGDGLIQGVTIGDSVATLDINGVEVCNFDVEPGILFDFPYENSFELKTASGLLGIVYNTK